ncbi:MAG: hypothetical protein ACF8XB_09165, partial [Planctomycetota bacterium JB042]
GASARRTPREKAAPADVRLLEGRRGDFVAWLAPLGLGEAPPHWYRERLAELTPERAGRSVLRLVVFHVGEDGAPALALETPSVEVVTADGRFPDVPVVGDEVAPRVRASVLVSRGLATFAGTTLGPGRMMDAIVAFDGRFGIEDVREARFAADGIEVGLRPESLPLSELRRLLEAPGREALVARVEDAAVAGDGAAPREPRERED